MILTIAVVAAPNKAISERTEICPINVAIASKMRTRYTYGCCISQEVNKNYVKLERVMPALTAYVMEED